MSEGMQKGFIKFYSTKGFGFIEREGNEPDIFFHVTGLVSPETADELNEGTRVEFDLGSGKKGLLALNVKII